MLPDWPSVKSEILRELIEYVEKRKEVYMSHFAECPRSRVFEGTQSNIIRKDGDIDNTVMKQFSTEITYNSDLPDLTFADIFEKLDQVAKEFANKIVAHILETIDKSVEKTGNVVDHAGKPFSADTFFEAIEQVWIEFGPDGKPHLPDFYIHPKMADSVSKTIDAMKADPECEKRMNEIIHRKKEEWDARETSRELVG